MSHDFKTAVVELRGVNETHRIEKPYGGKNISTLCDLFADSVRTGVFHSRLPLMRDSAIASEYAWKFLDNARQMRCLLSGIYKPWKKSGREDGI